MVWHIRSLTRWWEAGAGVRRVDVPSFQTLTNAEGKSTLENLVLDRGRTAEHFITLSINVLQTLVSSEEKARLGTAQRWARHRKRLRFVGREVWKMPVGSLSALCLAQTRHAKSWNANPHVDIHRRENKIPLLYGHVLQTNTRFLLSFWGMRRSHWTSPSRRPKPFQKKKKKKVGMAKVPETKLSTNLASRRPQE